MKTTIRFFEKPHCTGNARQKAILLSAGHRLITENLLEFPFTREELRSFFGALPVAQWFNRNAPAVKSGEVNPDTLDADSALAALRAAPADMTNSRRRIGYLSAGVGNPLNSEGISHCQGDQARGFTAKGRLLPRERRNPCRRAAQSLCLCAARG